MTDSIAEKDLQLVDSADNKNDLFFRTEDDEGHYAAAVDGSGLVLIVKKEDGIKSSLFMRRIIKPFAPENNQSILVCELDGVFLYVTEDNKFIMTKNGELR